ncbi:hypothetical protein [Antarcticirhabdus aurantiaca]|uniref:Uncharacterized protein n=1 Tax=Antarcticirhabdus aurantiaca TaxID=2606717 RepID=A0ACD4NRN3_9HYPH|nr:hypothetical protein OXU80_03625 [Jeongeuplla avenae]
MLAHYTNNGFLVRSEEAPYLEGTGTFTPLPEYDPATQIPRYLGGSEWVVLPLSARDEFVPPAVPGPSVPDEVSAAQAKTALYNAGIYDDVEAVLGAAPDGLVRIWWSSAQVWRRDHPYILAVATFLDPPLDDDQVDALFMAAAAVPT